MTLPWVSARQAAEILAKAPAQRDTGDIDGARQLLQDGIKRLKSMPATPRSPTA